MFIKHLGSPRKSATLLLSIIAIAGAVLIINFFSTPSEAASQFLFGLSRTRLLIGSLFALLWVVNVGAVIWVGSQPQGWRLNFEHKLSNWITDHIIFLIMALCFLSLATGVLLLAIIPPVIKSIGFLEPVGPRIGPPTLWLFLASSLLLLFFKLTYKEMLRENQVVTGLDHFLILVGIFLITFFSYEHILIWTGGANQSRYSYLNLLADEFLKGNLYLENPPQTHDLTLYKGKWYVAMPPFPAVLMMPLAYLVGGENINTSDFSIIFSALNAVLIFLVLEQLAKRKWITLSRVSMLLVVALFVFGTPHLWVGIRGRAWFVSQIITVTVLALAVFAAFRSWSPWFVGLSLGLAIAARPNGIMTWPFIFAITMQIMKEEYGSISWRQIVEWSIKTIIPMSAAVAGLLIYNYARFENPLDFGYTSINGDPFIVANAQRYGLFSPHYILTNLKAMFFYVPAIQLGEQWPILPSATGMSIFLVTPPLIYLFHRYERKWWILGAWISVFFNFFLLSLYHNTGAHQFGYRYVLDAIVPLFALLSVSFDKKIPWHFIPLLFFSIAFNLYGTYWFING
jgi:hypothetical protein